MKLKGDWDSGTTYDVGDVVRYTDGNIYRLAIACAAGITPIDTMYWCKVSQIVAVAAGFALDAMALVPNNISDEAITLKTETGEYLITVDDSGDTPELDVTAIEEEADEEEGET